jgi:hypothetical protein
MCFYGTISVGQIRRVTSTALTVTTNCFFTQDDLNQVNIVQYTPQVINTPKGTSTDTLSFNVWDSIDPSTTVSATITFVTYWQYYPVFSSAVTITSASAGSSTLYASSFSFTEVHSYSGWDCRFNIPDLSSFGQFQYYCPDSLCGGPAWKSLGAGNVITYVNTPQ